MTLVILYYIFSLFLSAGLMRFVKFKDEKTPFFLIIVVSVLVGWAIVPYFLGVVIGFLATGYREDLDSEEDQ